MCSSVSQLWRHQFDYTSQLYFLEKDFFLLFAPNIGNEVTPFGYQAQILGAKALSRVAGVDQSPCLKRDLLGSDAIRIIKLHPSKSLDDEVRCELLHTSLTECEEDIHSLYTAISYVWGDVQDTRAIFVDDKKLKITATLHSALQHIRLKKEPARLWADAICINQADVEERGRQVRQMGAIYACASSTIIYFNSPTAEAELFLETLRQFNANIRKGFPANQLALKTCNGLWLVSRECFLKQAWLSRIWVLQELLFSKDPWIQCGTTRCRWEDFCQHARSFQEPGTPEASNNEFMSNTVSKDPVDFSLLDYIPSYSIYDIGATINGLELLLAMARFRNDFYNPRSNMFGDRFLLTLLQARRALGVTDPRDMLHAHSTIARSGELVDEFRDLIKVDYSRNCEKLFMDMAHYFFEKSNGTGILSFVEDIELQNRRPGLASWGPDWTIAQPSRPWLSITEWTTTNIRWQHQVERYQDTQSRIDKVYSDGKLVGFDWTQESGFTHAWSGNLLLNVGVRISEIGKISHDIKDSVDLFDIKDFFAQEYPNSQIETSAIELDVYARLCNAINNALGQKIIPDPRVTPPAKVPFFKQRKKAYTEEHYECRCRIVDRMSSFRVIGPSSPPQIAIASNTTQYLIPTLVKETYIPDGTSIHKGRRLSSLPDGRLVLLPSSAKSGDHIVCLAGSKIPCILRPNKEASEILDAEIRDAFPRSGDFKSYATHGCMACQNDLKPFCGYCQENKSETCEDFKNYSTRDMPIEHYSFIGECFVETLMMGWTASELERGEKIIFAIH